MLTIQRDVSLQKLHTFHMEVYASYFSTLESLNDIAELLSHPLFHEVPHLFIGGGSNVLFCDNYPGWVIKIALKGIEVRSENDEHVCVQFQAGEIWHDIVLYCVDQNWGGIENLSLIPGCVGAAPMQNIGAYGVEIKDVLEEVHAIHIQTGELHILDNAACGFGYRESVFKHTYKNQYIITSVVLKLTKKNHTLHTSYGAIQDELQKCNKTPYTIRDVSDAVIRIRQSKLPNPDELGNAGSFFKNPEITKMAFELFHASNPTAPFYKINENVYKIPAGWLIEQCNWKGKRVGQCGSHKDQALVLVNYGGAQGNEVYDVAKAIQNDVKEKFNIEIQPEVNIIQHV